MQSGGTSEGRVGDMHAVYTFRAAQRSAVRVGSGGHARNHLHDAQETRAELGLGGPRSPARRKSPSALPRSLPPAPR